MTALAATRGKYSPLHPRPQIPRPPFFTLDLPGPQSSFPWTSSGVWQSDHSLCITFSHPAKVPKYLFVWVLLAMTVLGCPETFVFGHFPQTTFTHSFSSSHERGSEKEPETQKTKRWKNAEIQSAELQVLLDSLKKTTIIFHLTRPEVANVSGKNSDPRDFPAPHDSSARPMYEFEIY